ncbi:PPE family protein [Mycobacterium sp. pR1184]|uniref:PPE family protein n=1 Tax=Mycobacterium sp. pR1184 TaxID=3238981 RepID=UPI00351B6164
MTIDFGMLPPEITSGRIYAVPGTRPMLALAGGWEDLAAELDPVASFYSSAVSALTFGWRGPTSAAMAAPVVPYAGWFSATTGQAEQTASQPRAAAAAA